MQNIMPPRQRTATLNLDNGNKDRNTLEDMTTAIREQAAVTNRLLQHLEDNNQINVNSNKGNNGDILGVNL